MMRNIQVALVFILLFTGSVVFAEDNKEIDYLLSYLADSGCTFVRNGGEHEAKEARDHLQMKYNYSKGRIKTAEDFIDKIASKSSLSRKPYAVHCGDVEMPSRLWLEEALAVHRGFEKKIQ
ncbi:MAG: DUF5329 domain-containing protein [Thermodesulfobacteriota bacterium]|nr:DUF5329 domain-containing protein [Thermodesulfobacteriota bacterium]